MSCSEDSIAQHTPPHPLVHVLAAIPLLRCSLILGPGRAHLGLSSNQPLILTPLHICTDCCSLPKKPSLANVEGGTNLCVNITIFEGALTTCHSKTIMAALPLRAGDLFTHWRLASIKVPGMPSKVSNLIPSSTPFERFCTNIELSRS